LEVLYNTHEALWFGAQPHLSLARKQVCSHHMHHVLVKPSVLDRTIISKSVLVILKFLESYGFLKWILSLVIDYLCFRQLPSCTSNNSIINVLWWNMTPECEFWSVQEMLLATNVSQKTIMLLYCWHVI
jgi:hypothetical protein